MLALVAIVRMGSLKAAAARLLLTESALSHSIRNLEEAIGVKVFDRRSRRLKLTQAGQYVFDESARILKSMEEVRDHVLTEKDYNGSIFRVVVASTFLVHFSKQINEEMRKRFPDLNIVVMIGDRDFALNALENSEAHMALTINPPKDSSLYNSSYLFTDELSLMVGSEDPLLRHERLVPRLLRNAPIYVVGARSFTTEQILKCFQESGFKPREVIATNNRQALFNLVSQNLGVTFAPSWHCQNYLDSGRLQQREVEGIEIKRDWCLVWPSGAKLQTPGKVFIELCQNAVVSEKKTPFLKDPNWGTGMPAQRGVI